MKKIWSYVAMFAIGLAAGIVAGVKLMGDQIEINIKKIKTKKGSSDIDIPINIDNAKKARQTRREKRKQAKEDGPES